MSNLTLNLTPEVYDYMQKYSLRETPLLKQLRQETANLPGFMMQISPEQGQLMQLLVQLIGAKKTLDIGTFTGYSALAVAQALPPQGKVVTCDVDPKTNAVAKRYIELANMQDKVDLYLGPAQETLKQLIDQGESGSFDFAFIDADKNGYDAYYELCLVLLREKGLLAIDNVLWDGAVADPTITDPATRSIRAINAKLVKDPRVAISMIPIGDGLTLALKLPKN